jgi:hypothetical protein
MMVRNIDYQWRVTLFNYCGFEITGYGERGKSTKKNQQRRRILHLVSFSDAPVRNGN